MIICIRREFGSRGHEIGKLTAEKLGKYIEPGREL